MRKTFPILLALVFVAASCNLPAEATPEGPYGFAGPEEIEALEGPTQTPDPDLDPGEPTPLVYEVEPVDPARVAYDFTADHCSATWSTNATYLPCPGHLDEIESGGYVEVTDHTVLEGRVSVEAPLLIGLPGFGYPIGGGLFGKYPPFTVYPGDVFRASIACQGDAECDLDFSLEYYPPGATRAVGWEWHHQAGDGPQEVAVDLPGHPRQRQSCNNNNMTQHIRNNMPKHYVAISGTTCPRGHHKIPFPDAQNLAAYLSGQSCPTYESQDTHDTPIDIG